MIITCSVGLRLCVMILRVVVPETPGITRSVMLLLLCSPAYCVSYVRVWYVCVCVRVCGGPHVATIPFNTVTLQNSLHDENRDEVLICHEPIA